MMDRRGCSTAHRRRQLVQLLLLTLISNELGILQSEKRVRRWSVRPMNKYRRKVGRFLNTFYVMMNEDPEELFKYTRLYKEEFNELAEMMTEKLSKRSCINTITPKERLAITLSYLAQGSSMCEVARAYLRGRATVSLIIKETCIAFWDILSPIYMTPPTEEVWKCIQEQFYKRWNVPNCMGAIDGKHIAIQSPNKSGSAFYNYKHFYSICLMAICDAEYKFIFVDIGAQGICGDSGVLRNSNFGSAILNETLNIPQTSMLPNTNTEFPCYFVADEAFPLKRNIMRPYSKHHMTDKTRIFNYRLSRGRRVVENAFGILASRWRILRKPIIGSLDTVDSIVKATTVLHNFLRVRRVTDSFIDNAVDKENEFGHVIPGSWRKEVSVRNMSSQGSRNYSTEVMLLRDYLCDYFNSDAGRVDRQQLLLEKHLI